MNFIGYRTQKQFNNAHLIEVLPNVYMIEQTYNSPFRYAKGAVIWVKRGEIYSVYELDEEFSSLQDIIDSVLD